MKQAQTRVTYILIALILTVMMIVTSNSGARNAFAATSTSTVAAYEAQNVMDDLNGATIDGEGIDLTVYNFDESKQTQVLSLVEFCYSFYSNKQEDYGLYVYVYNPQGLNFTKNTALNKITLRAGGNSSASYDKYSLKFLNMSESAGSEGLFYKFKVDLTEAQRTEILADLNSAARIYEVSEIELYSSGTNATAYEVANTYTYKGFAEGYGSANATSDTLSCTVDGLELYLSLDVQSTYYRPRGTLGGYKSSIQDTLHSVYFSVPNEIIEEYGEMTAVHATWLNARTAPIFVTGNINVYDSLLEYIGKDIGTSSTDVAYGFVSNYSASTLMGTSNVEYCGDLAYNFVTLSGTGLRAFDANLSMLNYIFYAGGSDNSVDNYTISSEEILEWFAKYTANYGGTLVNGKYSSELFEQVDSSVTDKKIYNTDEYKLTSVTTSQNWWQRIWGTSSSFESTYEMSAIQKVTLNDMDNALSVTSFCDSFYVAESDYTELYDYVKSAKAKEETVYLFRYYQSGYYASEATEFKTTSGLFGYYSKQLDMNAYVSQMWVQLDFDIIDLTFTKNGVETIIPVIMSPIDIAADLTPPVGFSPTVAASDFWKYGLGIIGGLCAVYVVYRLIRHLQNKEKKW